MSIKLYADDVKLYSNVCTNTVTDNNTLQDQMNKLSRWAMDWQLPISYKKCCVLTVGNIRKENSFVFLLYVHIVNSECTVTDVGVTVDGKLKFSTHVDRIVCKGHGRASLIIKCFESKHIASLVLAFNLYVRPILEYCSVAWNPSLLKDINALESVQRRFTKRLPGLTNLTYYQRLKALGMESLELRRLRCDLLFVYKLLFGIVKMDLSDFFIPNFNGNLRGHAFKLKLPPCRVNARFNFFSYRVINPWNALPLQTDFSSFSAFEQSLSGNFLVQYCKLNFR